MKVNRRKLTCEICLEPRPMKDFPMGAVIDRYKRVCIRCKREQQETDNFTKELDNDPQYLAFMRKHYDN